MKKIRIISLILILLVLTGCNGPTDSQRKEYAESAIDYFSSKYNYNKNDIKIKENRLYKTYDCLDSCGGSNTLNVEYKGKDYTIYYDGYKCFYDNVELDIFKKDLKNYLIDKYDFLTFDKNIFDIKYNDKIHDKYNNNFDEYFAKENSEKCYYNGSNDECYTCHEKIVNSIEIILYENDKNKAIELNTRVNELAQELRKYNSSFTIYLSSYEARPIKKETSYFYYDNSSSLDNTNEIE